jgi:hypothetical protein
MVDSRGLILLEETVVGMALPSIRQELGLSQIGSHWVINAYLDTFRNLPRDRSSSRIPRSGFGIDTITTEQGVLEFSETGPSDTKSRRLAGIGEITSATGDLAG